MRQKKATKFLQHWVRVVLPKIRARHNKAATVIQALVRGVQARRIYVFAKEYGCNPQALHAAATTIQAHIRRTRARLAALNLAAKLQEEIRQVHQAASKIQRVFRRFIFTYDTTREEREARDHMEAWRGKFAAAKVIQRAWGHFTYRRNHRFYRIRRGAATQIQAWWRGVSTRTIGNYERFDYDDALYLYQVAKGLTKAHFLMRRWEPTGMRKREGGYGFDFSAQYKTVEFSDDEEDDVDLLGVY
eukprot:TRINITY_DN1239_c0_g1_i1.p1 TRINITY_DN1239_c0_g1~~TRINITY_DN1239_c0_g1_i1.p1  ORF type:complete len:245 (+),score=54.74 TRINITY_DN1239_c0_g1_i1:515-1249(+)